MLKVDFIMIKLNGTKKEPSAKISVNLIRWRLLDCRQHPRNMWEKIKYALYLLLNMKDAIVLTHNDMERIFHE